MSIKIIFNGYVNENGELKIYNRKTFIDELKLFAGKKVTIEIKKKMKTRSTFQNSYYWGVVIPLVKNGLFEVGYPVNLEQTHELLKSKFRIIEIPNVNTGEIINSIGSTADMTTSEMMDYFAEIKQWAAEFLNVYIPDPNEQIEIKFS